jgi:hypothetical protein
VAADYLQTLAADLLAASLAGLAVARTGNPEPDRVYISHNSPAWDECSGDGQLSVWIGPIVHTQVAVGSVCQIRASAPLCVTLLRCVPTMRDDGSPPTSAELTASADGLNRDVWSLLTELYDYVAALGCDIVDVGSAEPLGPDGGLAGWRVCIDVLLNDSGP